VVRQLGRQIRVLIGLLLFGGVAASTAAAGGGSTITAAPTIPVGAQQFGNTADMPTAGGSRHEYWKLQLTAGDHVAIDWESQQVPDDELSVYDPQTTDFTVNDAQPIAQGRVGDNGRAELTFTANVDGSWPIDFYVYDPSCCRDPVGTPYDFTVYVRHAVVLVMPAPTSVSATGSKIAVRAHLPDGQAISDTGLTLTLYGYWLKQWHVLSSASPLNGSATLPVRLSTRMRGISIQIKITASGSNYLAAHTSTRTVPVR
jgi:hypothetical protein